MSETLTCGNCGKCNACLARFLKPRSIDVSPFSGTTVASITRANDQPFLTISNSLVNVKPMIHGPDAGEIAVRSILAAIGEDINREGLKETPARVVKSWKEIFGGYTQNPADVFKVFDDGACDQMVILKNIEFYSFCEHHMLPFFGRAHVAYLPHGKVIGVSKLARLVDIFARRLQIQERLTQEIANTLEAHLQPLGTAVMMTAKHFCMVCRGVGKQNSEMVTSHLTGEFLKPEVRAEFFSLIR